METEVYQLKIAFHDCLPGCIILRDDWGVWTLSNGKTYSIRGSIQEGEIAIALDKMRDLSSLMEKIK